MVFRYGRKNQKAKKRARGGPRMSFKTKVLRALESETKIAKNEQLISLGPAMITPIRLMPQISQGVGGHAQRIGNNISLKKLTIKGFIQIPTVAQSFGNTEHLSRMFITRQRNSSAAAIIADPLLFKVNELLEYDAPYTGQPEDWLKKQNRGAFVTRRDVKKHYSVNANVQGTETENANPDSIRFFSMTITFGKQGKKLHYSDDSKLISMDFPYFMLAALHQVDGTATQGAPRMNLVTEAIYTDL